MKIIYKTAFVLLVYVLLQSRSGGPASLESLQVTGAPGSTGLATGQPGTCANINCHSGGTFNPSLSIQLLEGANAVTKYEPGKTYTLRIVNTPANGNPARYGFQAVALNAANAQAGDWGNPGTGKKVATVGGRKYVEHSTPAVSGTFEVPWVAPSAGTGKVNFYAAGLAANNNSTTTGDATANAVLEVEEEPVSSTANLQKEYNGMVIAPNPVSDFLNLQITSRSAGAHTIRILDIQGGVHRVVPVTLRVGLNRSEIAVNDLPPGIYIVQLCGEGHLHAAQMLKI